MMSAMTSFYEERIGSKFLDTKVNQTPFTIEFQKIFEDGYVSLTRCAKGGYTYDMKSKNMTIFTCSTGENFYQGDDDVAEAFIEMTANF